MPPSKPPKSDALPGSSLPACSMPLPAYCSGATCCWTWLSPSEDGSSPCCCSCCCCCCLEPASSSCVKVPEAERSMLLVRSPSGWLMLWWCCRRSGSGAASSSVTTAATMLSRCCMFRSIMMWSSWAKPAYRMLTSSTGPASEASCWYCGTVLPKPGGGRRGLPGGGRPLPIRTCRLSSDGKPRPAPSACCCCCCTSAWKLGW
mmetsp:Transcript_19388/g.41970  ORF Transcript_19388/g.41970 Transcript_19388/m.41970 type:complete len:203 (+) Transcript_19388:2509-3117(+)